jgi:hypothetical protein
LKAEEQSREELPMPDEPRSDQHRPRPADSQTPESDGATVPGADEDSINREGDADIDAEEAFDEEQEAYEDASFEDEEE